MAVGRIKGRDPEGSLAVCIGVEILPANEKVIGFLLDTLLNESRLVARNVLVERNERELRIGAAMERLLREERV